MKKSIIIVLIILTIISCKKENSHNFQIDVTINDIPDGRKVFLKKQEGRAVVNIDTTIVKDGNFSFKGNIKEPVILGIFIDSIKRGGIFPFINVNDHVKIIAYKDSLNKSEVSGSKLNDELNKLRKVREELTAQTQKYLPEFQKANEANDTVTKNRINKEVKKISNQMALNDWNYVKNNPDSYISPLVFKSLMTNPQYKDSIRIVFNNFTDKIKKAKISKPITDYFDYLDKSKAKPVTVPNPTTAQKPVVAPSK